MDLFNRLVRRATSQQVDGLLGYYGLGDWWLTTFSPTERGYIESCYVPVGGKPGALTRGHVTEVSIPDVEFLNGLCSWLRSAQHEELARRIRLKMDELAALRPINKPGYYMGRHYTTYPDEVAALKRAGKLDEAERLLLALVRAVEAEAKVKHQGVAPWYYGELAKLYRKRKDTQAERAILERYAAQPHAPGAQPSELLARLEKIHASS